jgi:hypothetical protein
MILEGMDIGGVILKSEDVSGRSPMPAFLRRAATSDAVDERLDGRAARIP